MIILDTNVISEAMRGHRADPRVLSWLRSLRERPVTTVINRAEVLAGIALLPEGRPRLRLQQVAEAALDGVSVCLPLVRDCAEEFADIVAARRATGRPIDNMDALIAAIARVASAAIATRNVGDFTGLGIEVIDPWA